VFINVVLPKHNQTTNTIEKDNEETKKHINKSKHKHTFSKNKKQIFKTKKELECFVIRNKILVACYLHLIFSKDKCFLHSSDSNTLANFVG